MKQTFERYRLEEQLFESKNSIVYRATSTDEGKHVVLKVLNNSYPTPTQIARFRHEYGLMHKLDSPYIPKVDALVKEENRWAIVMEDIGAVGSLDIVLKDKPDLSLFLNIAIQAAEGLLAINKSGIIHKDIKPANIIFNPETNRLQIIDFGLATELSFEQQSLTGEEDLEGTLPYISPEQTGRMNCTTDYRTDFYSLGIVLYKLCCWELPFQADDAMGWVHSHIAKNPVPRDIKDPQIPEMIARMVDKLMSKNKEARYQSVATLLLDLQECAKKWAEDGRIDEFQIARQDISSNFQVSQRLYGREKEIGDLLASFERVAEGLGKMEVSLVAGYSGIGKTALVHELHKPLTASRGYFIEGKFDQFKSHIPFTGITQAFGDLMRQLLKEPETKLQEWKNWILDALGKNAKVITDIVPELELIIGRQPEIAELGGVERLNRLNIMFERFTGVFTKAEHPLVLFLDDLQWVDSASLEFLKTITQGLDTRYFLLIGAYRSNEVDASHPFIKALDDMREQEVTINTLELSPLSSAAVESLVADSLQTAPQDVRELCGVLMEKTEGNPFFLSQFLKTLRQEDLLHFDYENVCWKWDVQQIKSRQITDNVVDLMLSRLRQLPEATQNLLGLSACIGNQLDLQVLSTIAENPPVLVANQLWPAIQQGILFSEGENLKIIKNMPDDTPGDNSQNASLHFLHDRVQQASYQLIAEDNKQAIHLKIGRLLLSSFSLEQQDEHCFDLVDQLNKGSALIDEREELIRLVELNLMCGKQAIASAAYFSAVSYLNLAQELLPGNAWEEYHDLAFSIGLERAKVLSLSSEYEQVEEVYPALLQHSQNQQEELSIYFFLMDHYTLAGDTARAVEEGKKALILHGINLPDNDEEMQKNLIEELGRVDTCLNHRDREELKKLDRMTNSKTDTLMIVLDKLFSPSYIIGKKNLCAWLSVKMTTLSLEYGNHPLSGVGYVNYGFILCTMGEYRRGLWYGELAIDVANLFESSIIQGRCYHFYSIFVAHNCKPIPHLIQLDEKAHKSLLAGGDLLYASYATHFIIFYQFELSLNQAYQDTSGFIPFLKRSAPQTIQLLHIPELYLMTQLMETPLQTLGLEFDEATHLENFRDVPSGRAFAYSAKICLWYLTGEKQNIGQLKEQMDLIDTEAIGLYCISRSYFYASLSLLSSYFDVDEETQKEHLKFVEKYQTQLKVLSEHCPANFLHKYLLVKAEEQRVLEGNFRQNMELYEQAIQVAKEHHFLQCEAVATECYGDFWLEKGKDMIAAIYLRQACYLYEQWGAKLLVKKLKKRHPDVFNQQKQTATPFSVTAIDNTLTPTSTQTIARGSISKTLDINTLVKASHSISSEVQLERLLSKMMNILIENAGAQKGLLLLIDETSDQLLIQAEGSSGQEAQNIMRNIPLEDNEYVSQSIIKYVHRSLESVVLGEATQEGNFTDDPDIQKHRPKSVLCMPILNQANLVGVLYLENNITSYAFTPDRLQVLGILASQAAIAIENSLFFEHLNAERDYSSNIIKNAPSLICGIDGHGCQPRA